MSIQRNLVIAMMVCAVPGVAHANRIRVTSYKPTADGGLVELSAQEPVSEPSLRLEGKAVRVWFPGIESVTRFEDADSGHAIRSVRLRAGAGNSAVLVIGVRSERSLRRDDLVITRDGTSITVRVRVEAPPAAVQGPLAPQPKEGRKILRPEAEPQPPAAPTPPPPAAAAPAGQAAPAPAFAPAAKPKTRVEPSFLRSEGGPTSSVALMIIASLALGAIYGFVRLRQGRTPGGERMPIEVIASKRLGQKHELVLIRAMGQDHLLSLHAGKIERLSSAPAAHELAGEVPDPNGPRPDLGAFGNLLGAELRGALGKAGYRGAGMQKVAADENPPFGADLLSFVRSQGKTNNVGKKALVPGRAKPAESEAVAGIARLRNRIAG